MKTLVLTRKDLEELATMQLAVDAIERAFAAFGRGEASMPPKVYLRIDDLGGDFRAMPSRLGDAAGIKWVNVHPQNRKKYGLPTVMGTFILNDPATAFPLCVMDGTWLTALRTGAAAAVASKFLAGKKPTTIGFVGAGVQSRTLHGAHQVVYDSFEPLVHDRNDEAAEKLVSEIGGRSVSLEEALGADIVCTATPSRTPFARPEWIRSGAHINAMGADAEGKQELGESILNAAAVYVDELEQATHSGEINAPLSHGDFKAEDIAGTLSEVVIGDLPKPSPETITVFDSTGLAIQDVALAKAIFEKAKQHGAGIDVDLVGVA